MPTEDVRYGGVTVLGTAGGGRYPDAHSVLVAGADATVLLDPGLEVARRGRAGVDADLVLVSHAHEDHLAGLHVLRDVPVLAHPAELAAVRDPEVLLAGFGMAAPDADRFRAALRDDFSLGAHQHVRPVDDGTVLDLGGRTVTVVHLPGHTAGHCGFLVEPDGFLFLGDVDLTSFGPYYGDLGSDLDAFEETLTRLRGVEARWFGTAHQAGVVEGTDAFRERLSRFAAVIAHRDDALLELLTRARTLDELTARPLVYRPHVQLPFVAAVELRTVRLHLARLLARGQVVEVDGRYAVP